MPPKSKAQARRTGVNQYGFKVKKPESGTPVQKGAAPPAVPKLKTPSEVTKPKAKPIKAKPKVQSRVRNGRNACGYCRDLNVAVIMAANKEHADHRTADLTSTPVVRSAMLQHQSPVLTQMMPSIPTSSINTAPKPQAAFNNESPLSTTLKPASTPFAKTSATKLAARTSTKALSSAASIAHLKITKSHVSPSKQTAGTTAHKPLATSTARKVVASHAQPFAMPLVVNLPSRVTSYTAPTRPVRVLASTPANTAESRLGRGSSARRLSSEVLSLAADKDLDVDTVGAMP